MIPFNIPCTTGKEAEAIQQAIVNGKLAGNGPYSIQCTDWLENQLNCEKAILTPSCTAALEMTALLTEITEGDEVILPSYTFVTTANAFVLRGAAIRFVDIHPATMNIDPEEIEAAITEQTKAIVVVHYAGVACDMDAIMDIADRYRLWVIEDAAQGLMSTYNGKALGTIGHFGTFSFHDTKNITAGEGGALIVNHPEAVERAEILQEKGTNRKQFKKGMVDKYTWRDIGSSFLMSDLNAAYLSVQFEHAASITDNRLAAWERYKQALKNIKDIELPFIPANRQHNAHMFFIKMEDETQRDHLIHYLSEQGVTAVTHYVPLHSSFAGRKFGKFVGDDQYTTVESERLLRLPLYFGIKEEDIEHVCQSIHTYFQL